MAPVARHAPSPPGRVRPWRWTRAPAVATAVLAAVLTGSLPAAAEADPDEPAADPTAAESPERELAERYAPIVMVKQQDGPCDTDGEPFEPAPVEIVLDNPEVFLRQVGNGDPVAMNGPGASDLFDLREGWYLDFPGDALEPGCVFEQDFHRFSDGRSVVYAHVASEADRPGLLALQYWFFWYHNPSKNDHEGDWEFVQLVFAADTAAEALAGEPIAAGYAQHTGGERSAWDDPKLEREGLRPVVYPARGSHASYFGQALYLGRSGREGFGCDTTDGPSRRLDPELVLLPDGVDDPDDPLAWLAFLGRWGQREAGFFNGPTGPFEKARWTEPITWQESLRDSSVVIPGGDRFGDGVVGSFCGTVEIGSSLLVTGLRSPATLLIVVAVVGLTTVAVVRRTRWSPTAATPIRAERAIGQIIRAAGRVWRDHPVAMTWVGLVYVPVAFVSSLIQVGVQAIPFVDDLVALGGRDRGGVGFLLAVFVGGLGNLLAFVYVSAVVARILDRGTWTGRGVLGPLDGADLRNLFGAVVRAGLVVTVLLLSIVGIPWAIRQLVRYQVAPQVVALEGAGPGAALRRSADLVRGRWWWTAAVIAALQVTVSVAGLAAALVVLVLVTSIPLWLFNVLSSVIFVVTVPVGAAAMAYVYGTLAAERTGSGAGRVDGSAASPAPTPGGATAIGPAIG